MPNTMKNMFTLRELQTIFPNINCNHSAVIDNLPMIFVENNLEAIAAIVKEHKLRRIYRGPRRGSSEMTLKEDAHSMLLYRS